jgi:hypothetical protein
MDNGVLDGEINIVDTERWAGAIAWLGGDSDGRILRP